MENNSLTPTPAPTPTPASSMPEFAAAPAAPAPVIPPATSMPSFGEPQPAPVTEMPMPTPAPVAQPTEQPAPVVEEAPVVQPVEATPTSTLGEISNEPVAQPVEQPAPATPTPEAQPATTAVPSAVEAGPTVPATPTPETPEKKKLNTKIIAIAGGAAVLVVAVIIGIIALTGNQKPTNNPASAPTITINTPDNSTPFADLDKDGALNFLSAVGKTDSYFPDEFIDETDSEVMPAEGEGGSKLLISYETKDQAKTIAFDSMDQSFKSKYADKNLKTTEKVDYTVVYVDQETAECDSCNRYVTFSNKIINHFEQPIIDPLTGAPTTTSFIIFAKNTEETVKRYLPVVAYLNEKQIVYSSEFKTTDADYQLILNVIYLGLDEEKMATAEAGTVPRAVNLSTIIYSVDKATGNLVIKSEISAANQLKPIKSFSVTDEEVADLI